MTDQVARMVAQYTSASILWSEPLPTGIANDSVAVDLSDGSKLVVRIMRNQTPDGARREVEIQKALLDANVTTARSLTLKSGDVVGEDNGTYFTISQFIPGEYPKDITDDLAVDFGRVLATFQSATDKLTIDHEDWLSVGVFRASFDKLGNEMRDRLERVCEGTNELFEIDLPTANIHGDLKPTNTFADASRVTALFGFETAERNLRVLDLARTSLVIADESGIPLRHVSDCILDGFEQKRPLLRAERDVFPVALRYVAAACGTWLALHNHQAYCDDLIALIEKDL